MKSYKDEKGREVITTEDPPRPKGKQSEMITTANIEMIKKKRAAEKAAAEAKGEKK